MYPQHAPANQENKQEFTSYNHLQNHVINLFAKAKNHIILYTDYLTDGDIVSSLYLSQYRKVSTKVLLGRRLSNAYMSRLRNLKSQNTPVFLTPSGFNIPYKTGLIIDSEIIFIDANLDFRKKVPKYSLISPPMREAYPLAKKIADALDRQLPGRIKPMPMVGKSKHNKRSRTPQRKQWIPKRSPPPGSAFQYNYSDRVPEKDMPKKLPKETVWQIKNRQRIEMQKQKIENELKPTPASQEQPDSQTLPKNEGKSGWVDDSIEPGGSEEEPRESNDPQSEDTDADTEKNKAAPFQTDPIDSDDSSSAIAPWDN